MGSSDEAGLRGSGVLRHAARERGWEPAGAGDPDTAEAIERHIEHHFGPIAFVWHELASDLVHVDVHVVAPTPARPFHTLVTSGMSDLPMAVPPAAGVSPYAELMLCLPPDWPLTAEAFRDDSAYWPIRLLKTVARLPHEYHTWIGEWHSVPNGDPAEPYAPDTPFVGVAVTPMLRCAPDARVVTTGAGKEISLLALVPLHPAEVRLKLAEGTDALLEAFDRVAVSELFDPARPSSV
ncbi:suppressor of fused domain protein [Micromonospora sp. IBHARD004]|uniref:suppressor of fused domain protein n=1 Tax=Micromonospora sp. IBHARD004 TaxID=3457764 RepID=UPI00405831B3